METGETTNSIPPAPKLPKAPKAKAKAKKPAPVAGGMKLFSGVTAPEKMGLTKYPLATMKKGECFVKEMKAPTSKDVATMSGTVSSFRKRASDKGGVVPEFTIAKCGKAFGQPELPTGVGVWRTK